MVYKWKTGYHNKIPASVAGEVLTKLSEEGRLTARDLVEESRPETAPLHSAFEWDDTEAAERWREQQGRNLIGAIVIQREEQKDAQPVRAFFVVEPTSSNYESVTVIMRDEDLRKKLFENAKKELAAFRAKYRSLQEFAKLFGEIDKFMEEVNE